MRALWGQLCDLDDDWRTSDLRFQSEYARLAELKRFVTKKLSDGSDAVDHGLLWAAELDGARRIALVEGLFCPDVAAAASRATKEHRRSRTLQTNRKVREDGILARMGHCWPALTADLLGMDHDAFELLLDVAAAKLMPGKRANSYAISPRDRLLIGLLYARNGKVVASLVRRHCARLFFYGNRMFLGPPLESL